MKLSLAGIVIVHSIQTVQPATKAWQNINQTFISTKAMPTVGT
jgi:hypothetical protein